MDLIWLWTGLFCSLVTVALGFRKTAIVSILIIALGFTSLSIQLDPPYWVSAKVGSPDYHKPKCWLVKDIHDPIFFLTEADALDEGRKPCEYCVLHKHASDGLSNSSSGSLRR